jgi:hypothetical protein
MFESCHQLLDIISPVRLAQGFSAFDAADSIKAIGSRWTLLDLVRPAIEINIEIKYRTCELFISISCMRVNERSQRLAV